jgi:hypothetical protein
MQSKTRGGAVRTVRFPEARNCGIVEICAQTGKSPNWIVNFAVQQLIDSGGVAALGIKSCP